MQKLHGDELVDPYFWMRERENPEVRTYLETENALHRRVHEADRGLPEDALRRDARRGSRRPTSRCPIGTAATSITRAPRRESSTRSTAARRARLEAPEQIILDVNALAKGERFMSVGRAGTSPTTGGCSPTRPTTRASATTRCTIKDLTTGQAASREDRRVASSVAWAPTTRRSSTRRPITPSGPTGSGGTRSAPTRRPTPCSTRRRTSDSGSAPTARAAAPT